MDPFGPKGFAWAGDARVLNRFVVAAVILVFVALLAWRSHNHDALEGTVRAVAVVALAGIAIDTWLTRR